LHFLALTSYLFNGGARGGLKRRGKRDDQRNTFAFKKGQMLQHLSFLLAKSARCSMATGGRII
jgi:hypothetical protein